MAEISSSSSISVEEAPPALIEDSRRKQFLSTPLETTIRMTVASLIAYSLTYAPPNNVIPFTLQWAIGLLAPVIVMRIPPLATVVLGSVGAFFTCLTFGLASVTFLLWTVTISDIAFLISVAFWVFWMTGLRYGMTGKVTNILTSVFCVFFAMVGLGLYQSVRDGIILTVDQDTIERLVGNIELPSILSSLSENVRNELRARFNESNQTSLIDRNVLIDVGDELFEGASGSDLFIIIIRAAIERFAEAILSDEDIDGCLSFPTPAPLKESYSFLDDQAVTLCIDEMFDSPNQWIVSLPGGFWLVQLFWKAPVMDPLALFPNIYVLCSWVFLCLYVAYLLPLPYVWTIRSHLTQIVIPQTLSDIICYQQSNQDFDEVRFLENDFNEDHEGSSGDLFDYEEGKFERLLQRRILQSTQTLNKGLIAVGTAFEPRIWPISCEKPRNTWIPLLLLAGKIENLATKSIVDRLLNKELYENGDKHSRLEQQRQTLQRVMILVVGRPAQLKEESQRESNPQNASARKENSEQNDYIELEDAATRWLQSMTPRIFPEKKPPSFGESLKSICLTLAVWCVPSFAVLGRLAQILLLPIMTIWKPKEYLDVSKFVHCIKFTIGFLLLTAMSIYWDDYRDFSISQKSEQEGFALLSGRPPSSFAGWELIAYVFATMPTTEGTVKKCFLRIIGTGAGGFSAWALIKLTGENSIGSVAWLTITSMVGIILSLDKEGDDAKFGPSEDFGYGGFYFVLTQGAIIVKYQAGLGEGNELVASRVCGNILGILMAVFISLIPPRVMGGDTKRVNLILQEASQTLSQIATLMVQNDASEILVEDIQKSFAGKYRALVSDAQYLVGDAKRFNRFPVLQVKDGFEDLIQSVAITCIGICDILEQLKKAMLINKESDNQLGLVSDGDILNYLRKLKNGDMEAELDSVPIREIKASPIPYSIYLIQHRIIEHHLAIDYFNQEKKYDLPSSLFRNESISTDVDNNTRVIEMVEIDDEGYFTPSDIVLILLVCLICAAATGIGIAVSYANGKIGSD